VNLANCQVQHVRSVAGEGVAVTEFAHGAALAQSWADTV
jgi:hypothetical protein